MAARSSIGGSGPEPPEERLPIPDFCTVCGAEIARPRPDLLDTIYAVQRRQWWLRETLIEGEAEPLEFVSSARLADDPEAIGREMRRIVGLSDGWAGAVRTWQEAVSELRRSIEQLGVMAVINGVVANGVRAPRPQTRDRGAANAERFVKASRKTHAWKFEQQREPA